eukprot:scaffold153_cov314-Prasinococcus_capsulatus_cf.AAC.7
MSVLHIVCRDCDCQIGHKVCRIEAPQRYASHDTTSPRRRHCRLIMSRVEPIKEYRPVLAAV